MLKKQVLVCPLDWGLGHATRDVIIIRKLLELGFEVILGADKAPLYFLRQYFPALPFIAIPSTNINYPDKGWKMPFKMLATLPKFIWSIRKERLFIKNLLKTDRIDILISDNRYGLWHKSVYSIFITHQLNFQAPVYLKWSECILSRINRFFIKNFNECWIPDFPGKINLSGNLSHPKKIPLNAYYIGPLSRFQEMKDYHEIPEPFNSSYDVLIILSGPEPQRTMLEKIILTQASSLIYKFLLVQGKPERTLFAQSGNISIVNHLKSEHLLQLILKSPFIITRSGYSTIMDLFTLQKTACLIPTPGQTEQEYLAQYLAGKKWFISRIQHNFNLADTLNEAKDFRPSQFPNIKSDLQERLHKLL